MDIRIAALGTTLAGWSRRRVAAEYRAGSPGPPVPLPAYGHTGCLCAARLGVLFPGRRTRGDPRQPGQALARVFRRHPADRRGHVFPALSRFNPDGSAARARRRPHLEHGSGHGLPDTRPGTEDLGAAGTDTGYQPDPAGLFIGNQRPGATTCSKPAEDPEQHEPAGLATGRLAATTALP